MLGKPKFALAEEVCAPGKNYVNSGRLDAQVGIVRGIFLEPEPVPVGGVVFSVNLAKPLPDVRGR